MQAWWCGLGVLWGETAPKLLSSFKNETICELFYNSTTLIWLLLAAFYTFAGSNCVTQFRSYFSSLIAVFMSVKCNLFTENAKRDFLKTQQIIELRES